MRSCLTSPWENRTIAVNEQVALAGIARPAPCKLGSRDSPLPSHVRINGCPVTLARGPHGGHPAIQVASNAPSGSGSHTSCWSGFPGSLLRCKPLREVCPPPGLQWVCRGQCQPQLAPWVSLKWCWFLPLQAGTTTSISG